MASETDNILVEYKLLDYKRIMRGLAAPKESGEHKLAMMALTRIFGPSSISLLLCFLVLGALFTLVARKTIVQSRTVEVTMMEPETVKLEDIKDLMKEIEIQPIEPPIMDNATTFNDMPIEGPPSESPVVSENTVELTAPVPLLTKSPLIIRNLYGNRMSSTARAGAMRAYKGTGRGEDAVLRALRWLKKKQNEEGAWKGDVDHVAMTGLALLCYLAHGETPQSEEFGPTVEKAIKYLISVQAKDPKGKFSQNSYTHGICTYAISEAYALTKIMAVKESMERAVSFMLEGQLAEGGFYYGYAKGGKYDTSVAGWNIQAQKAATMAGSTHPGLAESVKKSIMYLKTQAYAQNGSGFTYQGESGKPSPAGGRWTMTSVGTLCLQMLGHGKDPEARQGLVCLEPQTCVWPAGTNSKAQVYGYYYLTQAKFQAGESAWTAWNNQFNKLYVDAQIREDDGCGYWASGDHGGPIYATTLACLTLEVYYRFLPTYKHAEETETVTATATDDVKIEVL